MSDSWYRDPPELPPFEDGFGRLWTWDGRCLNPGPAPEPTWLDEWPEDLQLQALQASLVMEVNDAMRALLPPGYFLDFEDGR